MSGPFKIPKPDPFWVIRGHRLDLETTLCGLCVGYESKEWRAKQLARHIFEYLPEFALTPSEFISINHANAMAQIRNAAAAVYKSRKFELRGEFGELFLHAAIRQVHDSLPAISKIYYKTAPNETVKGFDAVHVIGPPEAMELWLGEAKFYSDIKKATSEVVNEIIAHTKVDYLRTEFALIKNKIDDAWPHSTMLKHLLSPNTSLDEVFRKVSIPVLLTYNSECVGDHESCTDEYVEAFENEIAAHHKTFVERVAKNDLPSEVNIHLFLMPLAEKRALVKALDAELRKFQ